MIVQFKWMKSSEKKILFAELSSFHFNDTKSLFIYLNT